MSFAAHFLTSSKLKFLKTMWGDELQEPDEQAERIGSEWQYPSRTPGAVFRMIKSGYFPRALITTRSTMTTKRPAEETAAAVSCPDMAVAIANPERINMMINRRTIPNGVRMTLMIEPAPLDITYTSPKTKMEEPDQKMS